MVKPLTGQANFSLKTMRVGGGRGGGGDLPFLAAVILANARTHDRGSGSGRRLGRTWVLAFAWMTAAILGSLALIRRSNREGSIDQLRHRQSIRQLQRRLEALGQPRRGVGADDDAIDDDVDVVLVFLVERRGVGDLVQRAVNLDALIAVLLQLEQLLAVLALAPANDRREQQQARPLGQGQHAVDHLADGLRGDRQAGRGRIGDADPRPQQAHVIVDLGDGRDRRTRILAGGLLLDADRRRQALDMVDVGLLHHLEELAGIGAQRFDVAPLPLGIDRVEGEARLARPRQAGDDDEAVARQVDVDVLEVVLARAANADVAQHDTGPRSAKRVGMGFVPDLFDGCQPYHVRRAGPAGNPAGTRTTPRA